MPTIVVLPKMGMTMTEGTLARWLVGDGERVTKGQPIFQMTTEKINTEVEAEADGILRHLALEDDTVPAGATVGCILAEGEDLPPDLAPKAHPPTAEAQMAEAMSQRRAAAPAAVGGAEAASRSTSPVPRTGGQRGVRFVPASPLARRLAQEHGIDLATVKGTGPGGRIQQEDVERAIADFGELGRTEREAAPVPSGETIPFKGMRRTIAQRMHESLQQMAQLTIAMEADVTEARGLLDELNERWRGEGLTATYTHLVVRAAAVALRDHPRLNATLEGDVIRIPDEVNVGVAVALDEGLIVPVLRDADRKSLREVVQESRELSEKARAGTLSVDEVTGGTFTVTTLGMYDVDVFTPIVNPPQCAILGVGRARDVPAFLASGESASGGEDDQVVRRTVMTLSLSFDHRVVDGAPAAAFLRDVRESLARPRELLGEDA